MRYFFFPQSNLNVTQKAERPVEIFPNVFFTPSSTCVVQPAKNVFRIVTIMLAPACKIPATPSSSFDAVSSTVFIDNC